MNNTAQAFWIESPGRGRLRSEPLPSLASDELQVRTQFSGISRGTEALVFHGKVPPGEFERMRAPFQQGDFPAPIKYGYASVGQVEIGPDEWVGEVVFCLFPHQDRYVVPTSAVIALPVSVPPERAILGAAMETAVNACWDAAPGPGDRICVVGAGVIGSLTAWLMSGIPGAEVTLVDVAPERQTLATALGLGFALPNQAPDGQDLVVHASSSEAGLSLALSLAGDEALILELSWFGQTRPALPLGEGFHSRRLQLRSSQVGRLPPARTPRWDTHRRLELALRLLAEPRLDALISGESPFGELPKTMRQLATADSQALCHRIRYP